MTSQAKGVRKARRLPMLPQATSHPEALGRRRESAIAAACSMAPTTIGQNLSTDCRHRHDADDVDRFETSLLDEGGDPRIDQQRHARVRRGDEVPNRRNESTPEGAP